MKANAIFNIWDDKDKVYGQQLGIEIPGLQNAPNLLATASSQLVYSMNKVFEKAMLKKLSIEQLEKLINLATDVQLDKIASGEERDNIPLTAEELPTEWLLLGDNDYEFKSFGLTKQQSFEIVENYIEYHCRLAQEMLQEAANDSLTQKTVGPYINDLDILLKFKEMNSTLLYHRFMDEEDANASK